ncbi:MAG: MFS transporter [Pyrinomonadaceae bacterium]|nr:MFS transporter [Pyrinomonadaceae bacterium]MCX7639988.1 MFS transporter [Pyrinomonadaceae bacterium]MDW8304160.1 MFS transporter [Acidobacteriota bacterium]
MPNDSKISRYEKLPRNVFFLSLVSLLNDTSSEIIYPLLPVFLTITLGTSPFAIGLIEGLAESVSSMLKLLSGRYSDRIRKRKPLVFLGYSLSSIARPLLAFTTSWHQVLLVRLADRLGKGIRSAPRDALLASEVPKEVRGLAFGLNRAADNFGAVIGPIISLVLILLLAEDFNNPSPEEYKKIFLIASIPAFLSLIVVFFFVKDAKPNNTDGKIVIKFSLKDFDPNFKKFLLAVSIFTLSNSTDAFLLLKAQQAGIATGLLPLLWVMLHISKVISSLVGGELSDRFGRKKLILSGWVLYSLVYLGFAFASKDWQIWTLFLIYGFYFGFTEGTERAFIADLVPEEKRGTAFGLYAFAFSITVFPASLIFGIIWNLANSASAFIFGAFLSMCAVILLMNIKTSRLNQN